MNFFSSAPFLVVGNFKTEKFSAEREIKKTKQFEVKRSNIKSFLRHGFLKACFQVMAHM
jgi:hypothetical protein